MNVKFPAVFFCSFLLFAGINSARTVDPLYEVGTWRGFRSCAVSFTFDDNTPNQISVVMPIFNQYGFKMTFFPVINWGPDWKALQSAALNGHEIGSHTVTHANLGALTDEQEITEYRDSQEAINLHIPGQQCVTIAYPYCVSGDQSICKQYYIAARGCSGAVVSKTPPDFMNISSIVCGSEGSTQRVSDFTGRADAAASSNGWVVFLIHAIDNESGYSPTSSSEINSTLEYFSQNEDQFWVSTFGNVARYIRERNNVSVTQILEQDSVITLSVTDTLDNTIYNQPVTIRRVLPPDWASARISQNGKILDSQITNFDDTDYIMFDVVPDSGDIRMIKAAGTGIFGKTGRVIQNPRLMQNYPNPFNPVTTIHYRISQAGFVSLKVYAVSGREIATLVSGQLSPGDYSVKMDGTDLSGGLYLYRLRAGNFSQTEKFILLK